MFGRWSLRKFGHREDALGSFVMHTRCRRRGLHQEKRNELYERQARDWVFFRGH
jgi:hypothetical protein